MDAHFALIGERIKDMYRLGSHMPCVLACRGAWGLRIVWVSSVGRMLTMRKIFAVFENITSMFSRLVCGASMSVAVLAVAHAVRGDGNAPPVHQPRPQRVGPSGLTAATH